MAKKMRYNNVLDSLQKLIYKKPPQKEIGKIIGLGQTAIAGRAARNSDFSEEEINKINEYYSVDIRAEEIKELDKYTACVYADYYAEMCAEIKDGEFIAPKNVPKVPIPEFCFIWPPQKDRKYSVFIMPGAGMMPALKDKDKIIIEHAKPDDMIRDNNIYAIVYDNRVYIRRLFDNIENIVIKSDNLEFETLTLPKGSGKLFIIGQVVGLMRDLR